MILIFPVAKVMLSYIATIRIFICDRLTGVKSPLPTLLRIGFKPHLALPLPISPANCFLAANPLLAHTELLLGAGTQRHLDRANPHGEGDVGRRHSFDKRDN